MKLVRIALLVATIPITIPTLAMAALLLGSYFLQAMEGFGVCLTGNRIDTPEQAIVFAKHLVEEKTYFKEAGFQFPQDYIKAIEAKPDCCSASYGQRLHESAPKGWSVSLNASHLKNKYFHEIEFNRCGGVSYNGGLVW